MQRLLVILLFSTAILYANTLHAGLIITDEHKSVDVFYYDESGNLITYDGDGESFPPGGTFSEPLSASIGGGGYSSDVDMQPSGFFGLSAEQFVPGRLETIVTVTIEAENTGTFPIDVPFNFLINEGHLDLIAGPGSTLDYTVSVIYANSYIFFSTGLLEVTPSLTTTFTPSGDDIGATFDGVSAVDLPFSSQGPTATIAPGTSGEFLYYLKFSTQSVQYVEFISYYLKDPYQLPNLPPDAMQFSVGEPSDTATVPEPSTFALLGIGGLALAACGWRRKRQQAA